MTLCALLVRPRCYDGFHVLCNFGVLRLPANDITLDREQLRKDDQHVLEHHQFHVSVFNFLSLSPSLFFFFFIPRDKAHSTFPPRDFSKFSTRRGDEIHFLPVLPVSSLVQIRVHTRWHACQTRLEAMLAGEESISRGVLAFEQRPLRFRRSFYRGEVAIPRLPKLQGPHLSTVVHGLIRT